MIMEDVGNGGATMLSIVVKFMRTQKKFVKM